MIYLKNYKLFENKNIQIYCDMDDVLTDFKKWLNILFLDKWNKEHNTNITDGWVFSDIYGDDVFWNLIDSDGLNFWSNMPWTSDGKELWDFISKYNPKILSKPSREKNSRIGKHIWCERELNLKPILSFNKAEYANTNSILIDDLEVNINSWINAGGIGILHKNSKDTIKQLKKVL